MRHLKRGRKLGMTSSHRSAMVRNLTISLFLHGKVTTTPAKAKETRSFAERLITLAKRGAGDLAARRRAIRLLHNPAVVKALFEDLGVRYKERPGGYTRILHKAARRVGDAAPQVLFELVEAELPVRKGKKPAPAVVVKDEPKPASEPERTEEKAEGEKSEPETKSE